MIFSNVENYVVVIQFIREATQSLYQTMTRSYKRWKKWEFLIIQLIPDVVSTLCNMKFISVTLIVFFFLCGTETNACSSNANKNEEDRKDFFEITGSIQKAKEEYEYPTKVKIQWFNMLSMYFWQKTYFESSKLYFFPVENFGVKKVVESNEYDDDHFKISVRAMI